jgi:prophage DNA circulation protein
MWGMPVATETRVIDGSFKGIPIRIQRGSVSGGRKNAITQFPGRDHNFIEDLGGLPRSFSMDIIVSDTAGQNYFGYRDRLLSALENKGLGVLEHPFYGRIDNVFCTTYSLSENFSDFGLSVATVNFEISRSLGIPVRAGSAVSILQRGTLSLLDSVKASIAGNFSVNLGFLGNFSAATSKINSITDTVRAATDFISDGTANIAEINKLIEGVEAKTNALALNPVALGDAITGLISGVVGHSGGVDSTIEVVRGLFDFGAADAPIPPVTVGRIERKKNNDILNAAVNDLALGFAYETTAQIDFITVDEIEAASSELETQYKTVQGGADQESNDVLTDMRSETQAFFNDERLTARQIITVETNRISTRLLSYQYYADSSEGERLGLINQNPDVNFISGEVKVLTA